MHADPQRIVQLQAGNMRLSAATDSSGPGRAYSPYHPLCASEAIKDAADLGPTLSPTSTTAASSVIGDPDHYRLRPMSASVLLVKTTTDPWTPARRARLPSAHEQKAALWFRHHHGRRHMPSSQRRHIHPRRVLFWREKGLRWRLRPWLSSCRCCRSDLHGRDAHHFCSQHLDGSSQCLSRHRRRWVVRSKMVAVAILTAVTVVDRDGKGAETDAGQRTEQTLDLDSISTPTATLDIPYYSLLRTSLLPTLYPDTTYQLPIDRIPWAQCVRHRRSYFLLSSQRRVRNATAFAYDWPCASGAWIGTDTSVKHTPSRCFAISQHVCRVVILIK